MGVPTVPPVTKSKTHPDKRSCAGCSFEIVDRRFMECAQEYYHEACFVCSTCNVNLLSVRIYQTKDTLMCGACYLGTCSQCAQVLEDETYQEVDESNKYHIGCLRCVACNDPIPDKYFVVNSKCFCVTDYVRHFLQCSTCKLPLSTAQRAPLDPKALREQLLSDATEFEYMQLEETKHHEHCFVCNYCKQPLKETSRDARHFFTIKGTRTSRTRCCRGCVVRFSQATESRD